MITKRQLIDMLENTPVSDDTEVILYDWQKNIAIDQLNDEGIYPDFELEIINPNPTEQEHQEFRDAVSDPEAFLQTFIALQFDNYDEPEISPKGDRELLFGLAGEIAGTTIYNVKHPLDAEAQAKIHGLNENVAFIARDLFDKLNEQI